MNQDNKVLFICYHFPPDSEVGAVRPAKFTKYLKRFGWEPFIITIKEKHLKSKDSSRLKDVEGIQILRTSLWPTILQVMIKIRNIIKGFINSSANVDQTKYYYSKKPVKTRQESSGEKIKRYLNSIFELPDKEIGWIIPCLWQAYQIIKKERINFVVTSSPPRSVAVIGLFLAWISNIKLITDLRDPLFPEGWKPEDSRSQVSDQIEKWLEKKIMEKSSRVITTTEHYTEFLRNLYAFLPKEKFVTIWNGYDSEDFSFVGNLQDGSTKKIIFTYLGTFYYGRTPKAFLVAVRELINEGKLIESEIDITFAGDVRYSEGEVVQDMVVSLGLSNCVTIMDWKPYKESLRLMEKSDILLLFAPDQYYSIPAKVFDYLAVGKAILCFARNGATADLIRNYGAGIVVAPENVNEIKEAIGKLYLEYKLGNHWKYKNDTAVFDRQNLTKTLENLIQQFAS